MMSKHFLNARQMVRTYDLYLENLDFLTVAKKMGVSYPNVRNVVREIQSMLAGEGGKRVKGRAEILMAVEEIKSRQVEPGRGVVDPDISTQTTDAETSEQKMGRLFEELKSAISDWAYAVVEERNKEVVDLAKKSNFVDYLKRGLSR